MKADPLSAVILGAGQASLATSYHLKRLGIDHVLLERGNSGETWRAQRWDSFVLTTPSRINGLPGVPFYPSSPDSFESAAAVSSYFEDYASAAALPLRTNMPVLSASRSSDIGLMDVETPEAKLTARNIVVASGSQNIPRYP
jgi:putative flavoprotein involved in K+ transport